MIRGLTHTCDKPLLVVNPRYRSGNWDESQSTAQRRFDYKICVPCGKCFTCRRKRSSSWHFRIYQEALHTRTHRHEGVIVPRIFFCTFTFNSDSVPIFEPKEERDALAPFIRAWREAWRYRFGQSPRYFAVSDRGVERGRIHLHLLIFDPRRKDGTPIHVSDVFEHQPRIKNNYTPNPPEKNLLWPHGWADCSYIKSVAAIHYVSGYMTHANNEAKAAKRGVKLHPLAVKHVCSIFVSQGLGKNFISTNSFKTLRAMKSQMVNLGKFRYALPRYYRKFFYDDIPLGYGATLTRQTQMSIDTLVYHRELLALWERRKGQLPIRAYGKTFESFRDYELARSRYLNKFYDSSFDYHLPPRSEIPDMGEQFLRGYKPIVKQQKLFS